LFLKAMNSFNFILSFLMINLANSAVAFWSIPQLVMFNTLRPSALETKSVKLSTAV
jgi:hypothetical protein